MLLKQCLMYSNSKVPKVMTGNIPNLNTEVSIMYDYSKVLFSTGTGRHVLLQQ